jgi:hypothetical protein
MIMEICFTDHKNGSFFLLTHVRVQISFGRSLVVTLVACKRLVGHVSVSDVCRMV